MLRRSVLSLGLAAALVVAAGGASSVTQAGEVDGLWVAEAPELFGWYLMVRENAGVLLAVAVQLDFERLPQLKPGSWEAYIGNVDAATGAGTTTTIIGESVSTSTVTFTSPTTGSVTIDSCAPVELCPPIPTGVPFAVKKIL